MLLHRFFKPVQMVMWSINSCLGTPLNTGDGAVGHLASSGQWEHFESEV